MKNYLFFTFICLSLLFSNNTKSQNNLCNFDDVYGLNSELYSGLVYIDFYGSTVKGHQFLESPEFSTGHVKINNQKFENQQLNYDIFKQKLLLSFTNYSQAHRIIEVPLSKLNSFSISQKQFQLIATPDGSRKIFQIIGSSALKILVYWKKRINTTTSTSTYDYQFTDAKREIWIIIDDEFKQITTNKSLLKLYSKEQSQDLKKWLKYENTKLKKASDEQLQALANYLFTL